MFGEMLHQTSACAGVEFFVFSSSSSYWVPTDKSSLLFVISLMWSSPHCYCSNGPVPDLIGVDTLRLMPPLTASSAILDHSARTSSSPLNSEMPLVCEKWRVSESEVSCTNISSSNTQWETQTPEHDCWIEYCWRLRYEWGACKSLNMSVATMVCLSGSFFFSILSVAFGA